MGARKRGQAAFLVALFALTACRTDPEPFARASRIESVDQAPGGPVGYARVGDFLLENDQVRAVVEQGGMSKLPLDVGGTLIDLDLVRQKEPFRAGNGLDQLGQIQPVANLFYARALSANSARITSPGEVAEITVSAEAAPIQKVLSALGLLLKRDFAGPVDHSKFRLYTEYRLSPGERLVRLRTTVGFDVPFCRAEPEDGCNAACDDVLYDADCQCPSLPERCLAGVKVQRADALPDRPEPMGIADILLGDLPRPVGTGQCQSAQDCDASRAETCADITTPLGGTSRVCRAAAARDPGVFFGDMLLFGGHLSPFIEGTGFDTETDIRRLFDSGEDTLSNPLKLDAVYAVGDRVSYGYAAPRGKVLIPVFGGPFSMGVTGASACRHDQPGCLAKTLLRGERWVAVGEGDPASAAEVIARARGEDLGEVRGVLRWAHSHQAISGAEVFALRDPRALLCDAACRARCGSLESLDDAALSALSIGEVMAHNRCRTRDETHLEGVAGIVTLAKTDVGTDPVKDGAFRMALAPGRYVLFAQEGRSAGSAPVPITVEANRSASTALAVIEPGRLTWSLVDPHGEPLAGRINVGRCLPGASCVDDGHCREGERCVSGACSCDRQSPWPLELGGARLADGTLAYDQGDGGGELTLPPGDYEVLFSHGPHHSISRAQVTVVSNQSTQVQGRLMRTLDRSGWTAADFHVHAEHSMDSGLAMRERALSFLAEDLDFLSSSDHDVLSRYEPLLEQLGARERLGSQVGAEVTTQELGHFLGYPLKYQEFTPEAAPQKVRQHGAPEWREKTPKEIFDAIRAAADPDKGPLVVEVAHPYSYFDAYGIDPVTLEPSESIIATLGFNPLIEAENFSGDFDAMELVNAKAFDLIRRPTVDEVRFFTGGMDALLAARRDGTLDEAGYFLALQNLSTEATRRILHRTPAEQRAALSGTGGDLACRCGSDGDCSAGRVCDPSTLSCVSQVSNGPPAEGDALCRSLRGVIDDWFNMLNRGVRRTGMGGSDVHGLYGYEAGLPRTLVRTGQTTAPYVTSKELNEAVLAGQVIVTNGPMIHFDVDGTGVGGTVTPASPEVTLKIRVETGGWYDVDRLEVYRNGELLHWVGNCATRRPGDEPDPHDHGCITTDGKGAVPVDLELVDRPERDAWYVVIALGLDGRTLAPVYGTATLPRMGTFEITQKVYDIVPVLTSLRIPRFPSLYPTFPLAITNPVWVDLDGMGWTPPVLAPPSWCTPGRDHDCKGN